MAAARTAAYAPHREHHVTTPVIWILCETCRMVSSLTVASRSLEAQRAAGATTGLRVRLVIGGFGMSRPEGSPRDRGAGSESMTKLPSGDGQASAMAVA